MERFGVKDESNKNKKETTTFGLIRKGTASQLKKMKPHFFRVMLDFMLKDAKIYIPTEFVTRYGSRLGSSVTLRIPNGETWEVELATDEEGLIWLVKGWEDFTKHHSLKQGDILVFRLEHDSLFLVMVFDPSASEKEYDFKDVNDVARFFNDVKVEEGIEIGKEKGCRQGQKNVGTRRMKNVGAEAEGKLKQVKKANGGGEEKRKGKLASPMETPNHPLQTRMRGVPEPRRDNASTSSVNPSFSITMGQHHLKKCLYLPTDFVFDHMKPENGSTPKNHTVMVSGEEGLGPWPLSFAVQERVQRGRARGSFNGGWPAFVRGNSLKAGDECKFELISCGQMKVTILKG